MSVETGNITNILSGIQTNFTRENVTNHFYSESGDKSYEALLSELESEKLAEVSAILHHPELQYLIRDGHITVAAIKPHSEESKLGVMDDIEGEAAILEQIKAPLAKIFQISLSITPDDISRFYPEELQHRLQELPHPVYGTVWNNFISYMTSGPMTYALLYDEAGNAVDEWRRQIGSTDPSQAAPDSIRGKYARSIDHNLVHGSANIEDAHREVGWLANYIDTVLLGENGDGFTDPLPELVTPGI